MTSTRIIVCRNCNEKKEHKAKGLCAKCYNKKYLAERRKSGKKKTGARSKERRGRGMWFSSQALRYIIWSCAADQPLFDLWAKKAITDSEDDHMAQTVRALRRRCMNELARRERA